MKQYKRKRYLILTGSSMMESATGKTITMWLEYAPEELIRNNICVGDPEYVEQ